jgi:hypothetical protein
VVAWAVVVDVEAVVRLESRRLVSVLTDLLWFLGGWGNGGGGYGSYGGSYGGGNQSYGGGYDNYSGGYDYNNYGGGYNQGGYESGSLHF